MAARSTPASAGRTYSISSSAGTTEHPRVGGEDRRSRSPGTSSSGTPPRRRGGHDAAGVRGLQHRNTLASAGRTLPVPGRTSPRTEHPRVGGEDARRFVHAASHVRNTPASAGRTGTLRRAEGDVAEHPRVGGEDLIDKIPGGSIGGTPPRRRGGQLLVRHAFGEGRNTPASAGRTRCPGAGTGPAAEHPRVGGEDSAASNRSRRNAGTPPRRRGGPELEVPDGPRNRNTPASAGRTTRTRCSRPGTAEHPRVGGEDRGEWPVHRAVAGTPPRRRGGRGRAVLRPVRHRNTPASAGRTRAGE